MHRGNMAKKRVPKYRSQNRAFPSHREKKCLKEKQEKKPLSLGKFSRVCHQAGVPTLCLPHLPAALPARGSPVLKVRLQRSFTC